MAARCLRCGAGSEWIEGAGRTRARASDEAARIEGARFALEAARASAIARAKQFPHRRLSHAEIAAWLTKLLPERIVRDAEAKEVDR